MDAPQIASTPGRPRRGASRRRTFRDVEIVHDYGAARIVCTTRDMSDTGVKIELPPEVDLPDRFLVIDPDSRASHEARPVWREGHYAGLEFLPRPKGGGPLRRLLRWLRGE